MANEVSVRFSGDTSDLAKATAAAKDSVAGFGTGVGALKSSLDQLNSSMKNSAAAAASADSGWRADIATLANLTVIAAGAYEAVSSLTEGMIEASRAGQAVGIDLRSGLVEAANMGQTAGLGLRDAIAATTSTLEAAPSAVSGYADALANGTGAARSFIHEQDGIRASIARAVLAVGSEINELRILQTSVPKDALGAIFDAGGGPAFVKATAESGAELKEALAGFIAELQKIPDMSDQAAVSIQGMLGSIPNYSAQANDELINLIATISASGDEAVANAQKIISALHDPSAAGGQTIAAMISKLVDGLDAAGLSADDFKKKMGDINQISSFFAATLNPAAASAYFAAITAKLQAQQDKQQTVADADAASLRKLGVLGEAISYTRRTQVALQVQENVERQKTIDLLTQQKALTDGMSAAQARQGALNDAFTTTLDKANPIDAQIDDVSSKISVLQNKLSQGTGDAPKLTAEDITALVRTVMGEAGNQPAEGQLAVAAVALNRLANGNFGDSLTKLLQAGNGSQFNTWLPSDPTGAQKAPTDGYQFQRTLQDIVMPLLQKQVQDPTGGALNFYNPSQTAPKNQFAMDNSQMIGDQKFGTAKNSPDPITPDALDDDDIEKAKQAVAALEDQLKKLNDLKAGGNATDQANLDIAQQAVTQGQDEVAAAQKLVDAKKLEVLASGDGSESAKTAAAKALADAQINLQNKVADAAVAASKVEADAYEKGSFEEVAATNAGLAAKLAGMKQGTAEYNNTLAAMISNTKQAITQEEDDQAAAETAKYNNAKRSLDEQMAAVIAAAEEKRISAAQELTERKKILDELAELERAHQTTLEGIWAQQPVKYREAAQQLLQVDSQRLQQQLKAEHEYQKQVLQAYTQGFEEIGANISSSLMGMLEGTTTWKGLMQNLAKELVSNFISDNVKMVADWAAKKATEVAIAGGAETEKTAAVAAGEAARTGLLTVGALEQDAIVVAGVVKSIAASAAEAFAGVVGFLAPILGPAAVPAAAGVEAVVLGAGAGIGGYAIGSWQLPEDQLAMVHAGEMIVPAAQTPWAQSLMANAASGSGGGGGTHFHGAIHQHFPNAKDGPSAATQVMKAMTRMGKRPSGAQRMALRTSS